MSGCCDTHGAEEQIVSEGSDERGDGKEEPVVSDGSEKRGEAGGEPPRCVHCDGIMVRPRGAAYWLCNYDAHVTGSE